MEKIHSVLITGASRGIGLEFVKQFLTNNSLQAQVIIATCRAPDSATALQELKKSSERVHILKLDLTQFDTYDEVAGEVRSIVGEEGLTLLINNAGIMQYPFQDTLKDVTPQKFISILTTNSVAPVILTQALYPLLKQSAHAHSVETNNGFSVRRAAVINITSDLGSIKDFPRRCLNSWCYNESKAALNMSTQTLAKELEKDGILIESIHPGVVETDMTATIDEPKMSTAASVKGIFSVLLQLTGKNKDGFLDYKGNILPF